jgi:hypothetical protein
VRDPERHYVVYVAEILPPDCRAHDRSDYDRSDCLVYYVGSTARGLRHRRRQHRSMRMKGAHRLGRLVPVMRVPTRAEAERGEHAVARELRRRGYRVVGTNRPMKIG